MTIRRPNSRRDAEPPPQAEWELQRNVARLLRSIPGLLWWHTPNEGKRSDSVGRALLEAGMLPGVPDVLIVRSCGLLGQAPPHVGIAIELKTAAGIVTPEQRDVLAKLAARGWRAEICRSEREVLDVLASEGVLG